MENPAIRVIMMPRDTNPQGSIFGGVLLSYIDQAGAVEARCHTAHKVVTVAMEKVVFHQPVFVGDLVSFYAVLLRIGRSSLTVKVLVEAERPGARVTVTEAEVVYVAVDEQLRP
ncbi:MAG: hotdog domain-containing protein, partial [Candidatus Eremiobacterota bacterium]